MLQLSKRRSSPPNILEGVSSLLHRRIYARQPSFCIDFEILIQPQPVLVTTRHTLVKEELAQHHTRLRVGSIPTVGHGEFELVQSTVAFVGGLDAIFNPRTVGVR